MRRALTYFFLGLLAATHVWLSARWMRENGFFSTRPPFQDAAYWRVDSQGMLQALETSGIRGFLGAGLAHRGPHPPLLTMLAALTSAPEGRVTVESQWRVEMIFLVLMAVAAYRLARNFGGRPFSVLAAAAMMSAPVILTCARVFYPKFPLVVLVIAALDALIRSRAFTRLGWSIAFGAITGVALLTFMLAPIYLVGSAVFALVAGVARARPRGRVVVNALLSLVALLAVASVWYGPHWRAPLAYAGAVTGSSGQARFSLGLPLWSLERWLYYPLALVNTGIGFLLSCWIAALAVVRVIGRRPVAIEGWTLLAGAIVSFLIIVPGQTHGHSEYVINLAPLGLLFAACAIAAVRSMRLRWGLAAAFGAACALTIALVYRPLYDDEPKWGLGPLNVIDSYDTFGGAIAKYHAARAAPVSEIWPIDAFLDLMVEESPNREVRLGQVFLNDYMNHGNMIFAARERGIPLEAVLAPASPDPAALRAFAARVDFMIVDVGGGSRFFEESRGASVLQAVKEIGSTVRVMATVEPTPASTLLLLRIAHPFDRPRTVPASVLQEPTIRPVDVVFDDGWRLVGIEACSVPPNVAIVTTFWSLDPPGRPGQDVFSHIVDGNRIVAQGRDPMPESVSGPEGKRRLAASHTRFEIDSDSPTLRMRFGVKRSASDPTNPSLESRVVDAHGLPVWGGYMVEITP